MVTYQITGREGLIATIHEVELRIVEVWVSISLSVSFTQKATPDEKRIIQLALRFLFLSHFGASLGREFTMKDEDFSALVSRVFQRSREESFQELFLHPDILCPSDMPSFVFIREPTVNNVVLVNNITVFAIEKVTHLHTRR